MTCCGQGLGLFDNWCYLIGGLIIAVAVWLACRALRAKPRITCEVNIVCPDCGERIQPGWKCCPKCCKPL